MTEDLRVASEEIIPTSTESADAWTLPRTPSREAEIRAGGRKTLGRLMAYRGRHRPTPRLQLAVTSPRVRRALILLIGVVFLSLYVMAYPRSFSGRQTFNSPRENVGYFLSQRPGERFRYPLPHYHKLPSDIGRALTPRDAASVDGYVVPKDYAGTILFHALVFLLWDPLVLIVTPVFGVLSGLALAKIGEELFGWQVGLLALLVWLAYPPQFMNSSYVFTGDTLALFALLLGTLFFLRFWRLGRTFDLVLMVLAFGFSILMRYPNVLATIPVAASLLFGRRVRWRHVLLAVGLFAPFPATILLFNQIVYGDVATTGYHLGARLLSETVNLEGHSLVQFHVHTLQAYLNYYLLRWPVLLGPPVAGFCLAIVWAVRHRRKQTAMLPVLASGTLLLLYYFPHDAWGATTPALNASVLRYLLPAFAIWILFLCRSLLMLRVSGFAKAAIVVVVLAGFGMSIWSGAAGVAHTRRSVSGLAALRSEILAAAEPDAIVATTRMDKTLFPERQTLTMTYLIQNEEPITASDSIVWELMPDPQRFAAVAAYIHRQGIRLYLLSGRRASGIRLYNSALRPMGLKFYRVRWVHTRLYILLERLEAVVEGPEAGP
jgi:hypothetical protein